MRREPAGLQTEREPSIVWLHDPAASDASIVGAKAATLARARAAGFAVLQGFVLSAAGPAFDHRALRAAWAVASAHGTRSLVVRSSSSLEDATTSSLAGRFESVVDVRGWERFLEAVDRVRTSASRVADAGTMGVLVQPYLDATVGGVLFGVDPVTGDAGRVVVECVAGSPAGVVSGDVNPVRYVLGPHGRVRTKPAAGLLTGSQRRELARLARRTARAFGRPQDVEWAYDGSGALWLLQSRPITAVGDAARATGPVLGPGPIGETFPDPLRRLEQELFVAPLREGIVRALRAVGVESRRRIDRSPVVTVVGNRVAADLDLLGWSGRRGALALLSPVPGVRRLVASWHVGRLRAVLPAAADRLVRDVDERLAQLPALGTLDDRTLIDLIDEARGLLVAVHGHQVLAGMLLAQADDRPSATALALPALAAARAAGTAEERIVAVVPAALALVPPRIGPVSSLPASDLRGVPSVPDVCSLAPREALRLRARWVDELVARASWVLGRRFASKGVLAAPQDVRELSMRELEAVVDGAAPPADLPARRAEPDGPALPAEFRLTPAGSVVPRTAGGGSGGRAAGGGRGAGTVRHEGEAATSGEVLVVRVLSPALAAYLPGLAGLVSETGSALSHLAILARELDVPTVVAVPDAMERFPSGAHVLVDGTTGRVALMDDEEAP